ncbi:alpha/beta fold hydrolase [Membranihabitans maritimus]|uniref:alpha/beta fold hydrolase n=1 Tax=Membranihabitans maritimus TaxID=2904244 RepID=UPI001F207AA2|nr:alpha/beta fold hydrolase [Membranihabitans maritimus]
MKYGFIIVIFIVAVFCSVLKGQSTTPIERQRFNSLPENPFLPTLLTFENKTNTNSNFRLEDWKQNKKKIKEQYQYWISGSIPPPPSFLDTRIISEREENGVIIRMIELYFGPEKQAKMTLELLIPPSESPLPVFMTQWNHRGWAQIAIRRGYIGCIYAGADSKDDTENYSNIYPDADFGRLMRRAWGAHRVVDYLYSIPEIVDTTKIGLTGHSRNAKQSLMAAAFDERIDAVVSSSGGTGAENPFRFTDERFDNNPIEEITRKNPSWFHPRIKLFIGKEHKLPIDQHSLMALIAPRGLMLSSAITEGQGNPWAIERAYKSVKKVYNFLDAENHIAINLRGGRHATAARDIEDFIDFFDFIFGRSDKQPKNELFYDYSFDKWQINTGESFERRPTFDQSDESIQSIRKRLNWLLGEEPPGILNNSDLSWEKRKTEDDYLGDVIGQHRWEGMQKMLIRPYNSIGDYLWANLYLPEKVEIINHSIQGKYPLVIFLHEYAYPSGYRKKLTPLLQQLTRQGFAVITFDQIGFGTRIEEAKQFYNRYPKWSLMGKMVADTRNIINDASQRISFIDTEKVYLSGYSMGGAVALFAAALDDRIKGVAVSGAFGSFKRPDASIEGNRHYSHLHGLIPRLGLFEGKESYIPVDFDDVLQGILPTPIMVIAPTEDRHHPKKHVEEITASIQSKSNLQFIQPPTYDHFSEDMIQDMVNWFKIINN